MELDGLAEEVLHQCPATWCGNIHQFSDSAVAGIFSCMRFQPHLAFKGVLFHFPGIFFLVDILNIVYDSFLWYFQQIVL